MTIRRPLDARAPGRGPAPSPALLIAVLSITGITAALMQTIIIPLVPTLPEILDTSVTDAAWPVTAALLAGAVTTPIAGRLGDMYGKRRILMASLAALLAGSVLCALSNTVVPMTVGRALQGAAMGVIALGISIMRDELPEDRVGTGIAVMSATLGVGGAIGMPVAAAVAQHADWHMIFWASAVIAAAALVLVRTTVPESDLRSGGPFDAVGALGLAAGLTTGLLAITKGNDWGWTAPATLGSAAASLAVFTVWSWYQLRVPRPLVDLRVSARRQVLFTNLASIAVGFAMFGMALLPPQILMAPTDTDYGLGLTMLQAGLLIAPGGLVMFACSPLSARITAAHGPRTTMLIGTAVIGVGYLVVLAVPISAPQIVAANIIVSGGIGIAYAAMPALIIAAVPQSETAAANGLNALMRAVGTSTSSAVVAAVLAATTVTVAGPGAEVLTVPAQSGFLLAAGISLAATVVAGALTLLVPPPTKV